MPGRPSSFSAGRTQGYHPRGGGPPVQLHMQQSTAYNYPQRGTYPSQTTQYPQQSYSSSSYPQQPPPRNPSTGWEQRPAAAPPVQAPVGYNYYGQGQGNGMATQPPNSAPANYYGQSQPNPYPQSGPPQQSYGGHGYTEPNYNNQAPTQQMYGQQQQPGFYPPQANTTPQTAYSQQPQPPAYTGAAQSYQGPVQSSYVSGGPTQQPYSQNYGPTSGYSQPTTQVAANYVQGAQPAPAYTQPGAQSVGYGQYPPTQPAAYGEQSVSNNANYGYQGGPADAGYANSGTPVAQTGSYVQPSSNPASYDHSMAQAGYGNAPVGYVKGVSPQPGGYGW